MITPAEISFYAENGFVVVKGLFTPVETNHLREHYMEVRARGAHPGDLTGIKIDSDDPLVRYPRMIHMHHWDDISLNWLLDDRIRVALNGLLKDDPLAVQTMLYFKPPGARGQALHQEHSLVSSVK